MKKTYQNPETNIVSIELCNIIAASLTGVTDQGGTTKLTDEKAENGVAGWSRHGSIWDEEE